MRNHRCDGLDDGVGGGDAAKQRQDHADDRQGQEQIVQPGLDRSCDLIDTLEIEQRVSTAVRLDGQRNPVRAL